MRQRFAFCEDGRTLRIRTRLRALGDPVLIQRIGLLEVRLPGQALERIGPGHVSCPIVGDRVFAGVEHPSTIPQIIDDTLYIAQHSYTVVGREWTDVPPAVFGSASETDAALGEDAVRRAFLRYLDTVRLKPRDMHIHYNNWWTMPVPFAEQDVLDNIAALKAGGNRGVTLAHLPGLNHLFQTSTTGSPSEYTRIEETMSAAALNAVTEWIKKVSGLR